MIDGFLKGLSEFRVVFLRHLAGFLGFFRTLKIGVLQLVHLNPSCVLLGAVH